MSFFAVGAVATTALTVGGSIFSADKQADAAKEATKAQTQAVDEATRLEREIYYQTRDDYAPYREAGVEALGTLRGLAQQPPPAFPELPAPPQTSPYPSAPQLQQFSGQVDLTQDPSYQFRVQEGLRAIEHSAAAKGQLQSGNTLKDLTRFGQDLASTEYANAYQRSLATNQAQNQTIQQGFQNQVQGNEGTYGRTWQDYLQRVQNQLQNQNTQVQNQQTQFGRLSTLAGYGQGATGGSAQAGNVFSQQAGENILGAGNARAAGAIAQGNAYSQGVASIGSALNTGIGNYLTLSQLGQRQQQPRGINSSPYDPWAY